METIIKNVSGSKIFLDNLGMDIDTNESINMTSRGYSSADLQKATNLRSYVAAGSIVVNNGISDLSISDGLSHLSIQSDYEDDLDEANLGGGNSGITEEFVISMALIFG